MIPCLDIEEFLATILNFPFSPTESQTVKQSKKNVVILMENQDLHSYPIEANARALIITTIHLTKIDTL